MKNKQKIIIVVAAVALVVIAGIGFWYWSKSRQAPPTPSPLTEQIPEVPTLGGTIFEKTQNPLKGKVPETNPFKTQANPFNAIYQNPFQ